MSTADETVDLRSQRVPTRSIGRPPETESTLEQRKVDEFFHLKKSKSGHLGYLNRIYRELSDLMSDSANFHQVKDHKQKLDSAYNNCLHVHEEILVKLQPDCVEEKLKISEEYAALIRNKKDLDDRYQTWTGHFDSSNRSNRENEPQITNENVNTAAKSTEACNQSDLDSLVRSVDELELKYKCLLRQRELQCKIATIKNEELQLREEIKQKEAEIQREMSLLEDQRTKASTTISNYSEHDNKQTITTTTTPFKTDLASLMTPSCFKMSPTKPVIPQATVQTSTPYNTDSNQHLQHEYSTQVERNQTNPDSLAENKLHTSDVSEPVERRDLEHLLKQQQEAMSLMASSLRIGFEMPKKELLTFDGNPINYWTFIKNFEINIERQLRDADSKLTYLIQQCTGRAREAIKNCIIISDKESAYRKAKEILHSRYGQRHVIAHAYINRLVNGPQIKTSDATGLTELASQMQNCQLTLSSMGFEADVNSSDNLVKVVKRLPVHLQGKWAEVAGALIKQGIEPTFEHLTRFVDERATLANTMYGMIVGSSPDSSLSRVRTTTVRRSNFPPTAARVTTLTTSSDKVSRQESSPVPAQREFINKCPLCSESHKLARCEQFKNKTPQQRKEFTMQARLCHNCLGRNHVATNCRSEYTCRVTGCGKKHHTFLHPAPQDSTQSHRAAAVPTSHVSQTTPSQPSQVSGAGDSVNCGSTSVRKRFKVSLRTLPVTVSSNDGATQINTYALLDDGSDVTLCSDSLASKLGLHGTTINFSITTVNGQTSTRQGREVKLIVKGTDSDEVIDLDKVWTVDTLSISNHNTPTNEDIASWPHLNGIELSYLDDKEVTILIGSDYPEAHWVLEHRRGTNGQPYAVRTPLGWTLMGPLCTTDNNNVSANFLRKDDELLHQQVERMFNADFNEPTIDSMTTMSLDDKKALGMMESSAKLVNGHYQLGLPWKDPNLKLPNNRVYAERRLRALKKRLMGDSRLLERYKETMNTYIKDNHARVLTEQEQTNQNSGRTWYLPHHPVTHPLKPNKVRVVFDCAARYDGTSLNENLLQGPNLTNSLVGVLTRFRQERVALAADIQGMFHQVRVEPNDCDSLRFLWWPDGNLSNEPVDHHMLVHLFGATSSPSCASYSLRKTALDNEQDFDSEVLNTVRNNFYVDDCLKSVPSTSEAVTLVKRLKDLLSRGGFNLTKWNCNSKEVLSTVPEEDIATSLLDLDLQESSIQSTLGLQWNVRSDTFNFRAVKREKAPTRRGILSTVSTMYDPLGFAAPIILPAKLLLQNLCSLNYSWDERVPDVKLLEWEKWLSDLPKLSSVAVPRCFKPPDLDDVQEVQLHHFSDASQVGYGAVSYLRLVDVKGRIHCSFVMGKSRVAPMKTVSIPRLELSAAVVSTKLNSIISQELEYHVDSTTYWTDSTSVLQYLRNQSRRFQTFVANRVAKIQESSDPSQWRYVNTTLNPADIASRGIADCDITTLQNWLRGPDFIWSDESTWPASPSVITELSPEDPEVKKDVHVNVTTQQEDKITSLLKQYSSWYRLQKAVAWILRFKAYMCHKYLSKKFTTIPASGPLTVHEIKQATTEIVIHVQQKAFPDEYAVLKMEPSQIVKDKPTMKHLSKSLSTTSSLRKLNPLIHEKVLRVGGRLERAQLSFDNKHPIILPSNHHVTTLLIRSYHDIAGHCGPTQVLSELRQKYWIVKGHSAVRKVVGNCIDCKRRNARPGMQLMAPLPAARLIPSDPPFTRVGVDYFGPLTVKQGRSHVKRYGCVFTCFAVRAVHIEIAHTLETDSFICAYQRFVSRRGVPKEIFSDNGTNFKGAERELREALQRWNQDKIHDRLRRDGVQWHFNPPEASHQGGVWERMIRSIRKILRALLQQHLVTDETLLTLIAEVERILNDRPLTPVSDSPLDPEPLTPNKLLLLKNNASIPLDEVDERDVYNKRWRTVQCLADTFWKRWVREYVPTLQLRQKWTLPKRNFAVGDLVLIVDDKVHRGNWPKGIITEVYPDRHGLVRQVQVKTATTSLRRDVRKLCLLEGQLV